MQLRAELGRLRQSVSDRGLVATVSLVSNALRRRIATRGLQKHPFDVEHGTDTSGVVFAEGLHFAHEHATYSSAYYGTHPSLFDAVLVHWKKVIEVPIEAYDFIDVGCGKGRVLLMASELPFRTVLGTDLSQPLVDVAKQNVAKWIQQSRACNRIEVRCLDALDLELPPDPVAIYMYHPFGIPVMKPFLQRLSHIASSRNAPIDLLYVNPVHLDVAVATTGLELIANIEHEFTAEEFKVDAFQEPRHRFAILRFPSRGSY